MKTDIPLTPLSDVDLLALYEDVEARLVERAIEACPRCLGHWQERRHVLDPLFRRVAARAPRPAREVVARRYFGAYHAGEHRLPAVFPEPGCDLDAEDGCE